MWATSPGSKGIARLMSQPEAKLSRRILDELRRQGYFAFKVHGSEYMMSGLPDIIACVEGYFVGFETKLPSKRTNTSPRQDRVHQLIREAKGVVFVVCSPTEAIRVIRLFLKELGLNKLP